MGEYTDLSAVSDMLRSVNKRIEIGAAEPQPGTNTVDISVASVNRIIDKEEAKITRRLARFYNVPLTLASENTADLLEEMATMASAYRVWLNLSITFSADIPEAVQAWKDSVDEMLNRIVPDGKRTAEAGRDEILEGESLLADEGDPSGLVFGLTNKVPYGTYD